MNEVEQVLSRSKSGKKERKTATTFRRLAHTAVEAILEKKGRDILVMDMQSVSGIADVFVLCTGDSDLQIKAIADAVQDRVRERHGEKPWHVEGYEYKQWVLLDYVDLVVHVFLEERREFYGLERLWGDAQREEVVDTGASPTVRLLEEPGQGAPAEDVAPEPSVPPAPGPRKSARASKRTGDDGSPVDPEKG